MDDLEAELRGLAAEPSPGVSLHAVQSRVRRHRRRRNVVVGAMAAVVIVGAAVAGSVLISDEPQWIASPPPVPTESIETAETAEAVCAGIEPEWDPLAAEPRELVIPDGATRAWLCGDGGDWVGPAEPLETSPDAIAAGAPSLWDPDPQELMQCDDSAPAFTLVLDYPGERITISASLGNCDAVVGAGYLRSGSSFWLAELTTLWEAQRASVTTSQPTSTVTCPARESLIPVAMERITGAMSCSGERLPDDVVAEFAAAALREGSHFGPGETSPVSGAVEPPVGVTLALVLHNAFGDPLQIYLDAEGHLYWYQGDEWVVWEPTGRIAERLAPYLPSEG